MVDRLSKMLLVCLISLSLLSSGCSSFKVFPADLNEEATQASDTNTLKSDLNTQKMPLLVLRELALNMSLRYQEAEKGNVEAQRYYQTIILGLLAGAAAAVLFGASSDTLKALTISAGTVYAFGEYNMNTDRRRILEAATGAYLCIVAKIGQLVPGNSTLAEFVESLHTAKASYKNMEGAYESLCAYLDDPMLHRLAANDSTFMLAILSKARTELNKVNSIQNSIADLEEDLLSEIQMLDQSITTELARAEPSYEDFRKTASANIAKGQGLVTQNSTSTDPKAFKDSIKDDSEKMKKLTDSDAKEFNTVGKTKEYDDYVGIREDFTRNLAKFELSLIPLQRDEQQNLRNGIAAAKAMPDNCWLYATSETEPTANPPESDMKGANGSTKTVILSGFKGKVSADVLDDAKDILNADVDIHADGKQILILTLPKAHSGAKKIVRILLSDNYGLSLIVKVHIHEE